jgi:hypothetical protein
MGEWGGSGDSVALIAAMVTPALLILGSASLVASALVRMARVVDRARAIAAAVHSDPLSPLGLPAQQIRVWLERHALRARYIERSITLLYAAVVAFIASCLAIPLDRASNHAAPWLPIALAFGGTVLLLAGGAWMVAESRLSGEQIAEEINRALAQLEGAPP